MTLPRRIPKVRNRSARWRSQAHASFVRSHECCVPGCTDRPIEAAHVRVGTGTGMGQRPHDFYLISLCRDHHAEQHRIGEPSFEAKHGINMPKLADEFAAASPKAHEIRKARDGQAV